MGSSVETSGITTADRAVDFSNSFLSPTAGQLVGMVITSDPPYADKLADGTATQIEAAAAWAMIRALLTTFPIM